MQCPLLTGQYTKQCKAVKAILVLSDKQLELYCLSGKYDECPIYINWKGLAGQNMHLVDYARINRKMAEISGT